MRKLGALRLACLSAEWNRGEEIGLRSCRAYLALLGKAKTI